MCEHVVMYVCTRARGDSERIGKDNQEETKAAKITQYSIVRKVKMFTLYCA